ncbi:MULTISPECIES: hypothetical protein [Halomonadaceae]|uniref:Uncharacterized protein n=1 Tax=Vreelandella titanicae TaxID=664683 RepID=A0AAP9NM14_9GAMM|nr:MULTISPECIES: hypothetical protein [Halomonas]QKS24221.1 hypothetical protein FX987_01995 [Halomonas titanicae]CDG54535.1 conserved hypothetical protein [Halomonas sp. A3H3]SDI31079.1 hypothetical protein SAMN04487867_104215 [Halomonas titanicae]
MNHVISLKFVINHWRLFAMQDGYTLHGTVIYAETVLGGGYLPAFIGKEGTKIIVRMAVPLPTELAARNALRNVLWGAHVEQRINLHANPALAAQELAA